MLKGITEKLFAITVLISAETNTCLVDLAEQALKDIEAIDREYVMIKISDAPHDLGAECLWTSLPRTVRVTATLLQKAIKEHGDKNDN